MSADGRFARDIAERQVAMFAMFVGPGLYTTRAALAAASGISTSTLKDWAHGVTMPLHGALALARFLPREAMNMLTEPAGLRLADIETSRANWDAVAASAGLVAEVCEARSDGTIDHVETERLRHRTRHVIAELSAAAEEG
jgi:hypothetical protein